MNHLDIMGSFNEFRYILYRVADTKLTYQYDRMLSILINNGNGIPSDWPLTAGILLENGDNVIAGIFLNDTKFSKSFLVQLAHVDDDYRKQGIYTQLHKHLSSFGKSVGKENIYSYIHLSNKPMVNYISEKIGYTPISQLVKRPVK